MNGGKDCSGINHRRVRPGLRGVRQGRGRSDLEMLPRNVDRLPDLFTDPASQQKTDDQHMRFTIIIRSKGKMIKISHELDPNTKTACLLSKSVE